jgi:hypothetical protein
MVMMFGDLSLRKAREAVGQSRTVSIILFTFIYLIPKMGHVCASKREYFNKVSHYEGNQRKERLKYESEKKVRSQYPSLPHPALTACIATVTNFENFC